MTAELWNELSGRLDRIEAGVNDCRAEQAATNATLHTLVGNGQPGRIGQIEIDVRAHGNFINGCKAVLAVAGGLAGAGAVVLHFLR